MTSHRKYQRVVKNLARNTNLGQRRAPVMGERLIFVAGVSTLLHARKPAKLNTSFMKTFLKMF